MKARGGLWKRDGTCISLGRVTHSGLGWLQILEKNFLDFFFLVFGINWIQNVLHRK